jgi:hypothetical protein
VYDIVAYGTGIFNMGPAELLRLPDPADLVRCDKPYGTSYPLSVKPSAILRETVMQKFLLALLTIAALSGAVYVAHSKQAAAFPFGPAKPR